MTNRLISNPTLWNLHRAQGRIPELCDWARANGMNPNEVSADDDVTIEDSPDGRIIRYRAYVLSSSGSKQADPIRSGEPLTEERAVPLVVAPPDGWPVYAVPGPA
jgi:hypothetical protein